VTPGLSILVGGEAFQLQSAGGVSQIYRRALPILMMMDGVKRIDVIYQEPVIPKQSVSGFSDQVYGWWCRGDRRPYRLRQILNRNVFGPFNRWRFCRTHASVYLPTYYTPSPPSVPSVCFVYDMIYERCPDSFTQNEVSKTLEAKNSCIKNATRLLCISEQTKTDVICYYNIDPSRCDVVYLGGGERIMLPSHCCRERSECYKFLYVGDWRTPYKNFAFMLRAIREWQHLSKSTAELHVASRIPITSTDKTIHSNLASSDIIYHESADDAELNRLYCEADVFVYPSLWEGFGIPVVEAMACGCAVMCSDIPAFREVGGDAVDYFDPADLNSFCECLNRSLSSGRSPDAVKTRIDRAAMFTWQKCADAMLKSIRMAVTAG